MIQSIRDAQKIRKVNLHQSANELALVRDCTPKNRLNGGQKLVLILKLTTLLDAMMSEKLKWLWEALKPYVKITMDGQDASIEEFAPLLSFVLKIYCFFSKIKNMILKEKNFRLYDHYALIKYFRYTIGWFNYSEIDWLYIAYMMVLEKSKHLKNQ